MTARDRFYMDLKCSDCGRVGRAHVSENDGASYVFGKRERQVDNVPQGFIVVNDGANHDETTTFRCECGSLVWEPDG